MRLSEAEMVRLWELHTQLEFATKDAAATVATMSADNYVNHVPVMTGGRGRDEMIEFYGKHFIHKIASERIYWDQASVLLQLGLLDPIGLPVVGVASARKFEDHRLLSNELIQRKELP